MFPSRSVDSFRRLPNAETGRDAGNGAAFYRVPAFAGRHGPTTADG